MICIISITMGLILMLIISMTMSKHFLLTPEFGLLSGFILAFVVCSANIKKWDLQFSSQTFIVVIFGFVTIVIVSLMSKSLFKINKTLFAKFQRPDNKEIHVNRGILIIWTIVSIINLILVARFLMITTGSTSLQFGINAYRTQIYNTKNAEVMPFFIRIFRSMSIYSGYIFLYLVLYNILNKIKNRNNIFYIINIVCAVVSSLIVGGSRGSLLQYIVSGITIYCTLYSIKRYSAFTFKQVFCVLIILGIFMLIFGQLSTWLGRGEVENLRDTISIYLSGGIINLDTYLSKSDIFRSEKNYTFIELINSYFRLTGQPYRQYRGILADTYMIRNGVNMGNVYTMFASYYHDGGMAGVFVYSAIMALIGQWILFLSIKYHKNGSINIALIIYGYLYFDLVQCNFSNRFYSQLFCDTMIKFILFSIVFKAILTTKRIRLRIRSERAK